MLSVWWYLESKMHLWILSWGKWKSIGLFAYLLFQEINLSISLSLLKVSLSLCWKFKLWYVKLLHLCWYYLAEFLGKCLTTAAPPKTYRLLYRWVHQNIRKVYKYLWIVEPLLIYINLKCIWVLYLFFSSNVHCTQILLKNTLLLNIGNTKCLYYPLCG